MQVFVEKLLRVQPDVERLFLLVRAPDADSAMHRMKTEVQLEQLATTNYTCFHFCNFYQCFS